MADRFNEFSTSIASPAPITEAMKKKYKRNKELKKVSKKTIEKTKLENASKTEELKSRIKNYLNSYEEKEKNEIESIRNASNMGVYYKAPESPLLFVVRIRGINKLPPKPKLILRLFRLRQIHNGVFIKKTKATLEMLKFIQPYVTYGTPTLSVIRQLCYKRGYARVGPPGRKQRLRISDNEVIQKYLGKFNMLGMEDLINEIYTCGPHFKYVSKFFWPFKLNSPKKGYRAKRHGFNECKGGDWGDRGELINKLVKRMI